MKNLLILSCLCSLGISIANADDGVLSASRFNGFYKVDKMSADSGCPRTLAISDNQDHVILKAQENPEKLGSEDDFKGWSTALDQTPVKDAGAVYSIPNKGSKPNKIADRAKNEFGYRWAISLLRNKDGSLTYESKSNFPPDTNPFSAKCRYEKTPSDDSLVSAK